MANAQKSRGFTFVEILVTLALFSILFVPVMQLFANAMEATNNSRALITALSLARWEMERTRNIGFVTKRLVEQGSTVYPPADEPPLMLNGQPWRVKRTLKNVSDPVEVEVTAQREGDSKPMARLATLITDTSWSKDKQLVADPAAEPPK